MKYFFFDYIMKSIVKKEPQGYEWEIQRKRKRVALDSNLTSYNKV